MKKVVSVVIAIILLAGITTGIVFGVRSCNNANKTENELKNNTSYEMIMLKDEYTIGEKIIFDFVVFSDVKYKSITYSLNNGAEQSLTGVKTGDSVDHKEHKANSGKYYLDTGAQIIDTTEMTAGYYTLVFFCSDADNAKYQMPSKPFMIKLVAAAAA